MIPDQIVCWCTVWLKQKQGCRPWLTRITAYPWQSAAGRMCAEAASSSVHALSVHNVQGRSAAAAVLLGSPPQAAHSLNWLYRHRCPISAQYHTSSVCSAVVDDGSGAPPRTTLRVEQQAPRPGSHCHCRLPEHCYRRPPAAGRQQQPSAPCSTPEAVLRLP